MTHKKFNLLNLGKMHRLRVKGINVCACIPLIEADWSTLRFSNARCAIFKMTNDHAK